MKTQPLNVRLTTEERSRLTEIAREECNTVSGALRHCLALGLRAYDARREAEAATALEF